VNAPWVRYCDCSRNNWSVTWTSDHFDYKPDWWKEITCHDDSVTNNPNIYTTGGSDYKVGDTYVNVSGTQTNKTDSYTTAWNNAPSNSTIYTTGKSGM